MLALRLGRGRALVELDRQLDADEEFRHVLKSSRAIGARLLELRAATEIALRARSAGDDAAVLEVLERVRDLVDGNVDSMYVAAGRSALSR